MLYQKYRPQRVEDLYGQKRIVDFLSTVTEENHPTSVIFHGPSGTGKTTSVRLLANKLWPDDAGSLQSNMDYIEFSGVENSGVNDMRELKDRLMLSTFSGKPRLVVVDEAHGLSSKAFDALLKVTEDSTHNIFVFITTAFDKIPQTIKTRSLIYGFDPPTTNTLKELVSDISSKEGFDLDDEAAGIIAFKSGDSYRAALNVLEPILNSAAAQNITKITTDFLEENSVLVSKEEIRSIKEFPNTYYKKGLMGVLDLLKGLGNDPYELLNFATFMYNVVKKGAMKNSRKQDIAFLANMGEVISNKYVTLTKTMLETAIFKTLRDLER